MNRTPTTPTFPDLLDKFEDSIFYNLFCHLPGSIVSYDRTTGLAVVQPGLLRVFPNYAAPGAQTTAPYKPIANVPVFFAQAGGVSIGGDPKAGDPCMLAVLDRNVDAWLQNGGQPAPGTDRAHSLSDCFCFVGFNPISAPLASARLAGEVGIAEPLAGTGAKVVVKNGLVSIGNNTTTLLLALNALCTALDALTVNTGTGVISPATVTAINAAKTLLGEVLY